VYSRSACLGCHTIQGVSPGVIGPNLTHVSSRTTIAAGLFPNDSTHLARWIADAPSLKPGSLMLRMAPPLTEADNRGAGRLPSELEMSRAGAHATHTATGWKSWLTTSDHKRIGLLYFWTAFSFFLVGGLEALVVRLQLAQPNGRLVGAELYNQLFTMHATTMVFLALMPLSRASSTTSCRFRSARATWRFRGSTPSATGYSCSAACS